MENSKPFKLGIIGAGGIGSIHIRNSIDSRNVELVGICELKKSQAEACINDQPIPIVESVGELIKFEPEGIIIASSTNSHGEVAKEIIEAKIPFLCEKPLASDLSQATQIANFANEKQIFGAMAFNRRYHQRYIEIRDAIQAGEIGTPETINIISRSANPPSAKFISTSGGLFGEKGSHFYDLIRWIFETNIHSVFACGDALFDPEFKAINQPDTAVVLMRLETGVLCSLNFSWRSGYGHDERLEISGSNGAIHSVKNSDAAYHGYAKGKFSQIEKFPNWNEIFRQTYRDELDFFISEARSNDGIKLPTLFDGVKAQKVADAITLSYLSKKPIDLKRQ